MNVLFLTISRIQNIESRGIYTDLMRKFRDEGHNVYIVTPYERKYGLSTSCKDVDNVHIIGVKTLNIQKTNIVEKGIGTILLEHQFINAINKYLFNVRFDLILYSTPPITFTNVIKTLKRANPSAISYLLLKDIFPQNAVDLGMFSKNSFFYKYFRKKEVDLYRISDYIGCMSPANIEFILKHNPFIPHNRVELAPNSIELSGDLTIFDKNEIRKHYNLPIDKPIFIYGGNLGKPQGVDFLINCLEINKKRNDLYFVIIGSGTEFLKIKQWFKSSNPCNAMLLNFLPKEEYDCLVRACDIGLIFLHHQFTIPNFPSRMLSYLENKMPILAATDVNTDIGRIAVENNFGYWCESVSVNDFNKSIDKFIENPENISLMGERGYKFLKSNYLVEHTYHSILKHFS